MPRKEVKMAPKTTAEKPATVDAWVATPRTETESVTPTAPPPEEKTKRLTLDIPESLHRAIKSEAVNRGVTMVDMLRDELFNKYGNTETQK